MQRRKEAREVSECALKEILDAAKVSEDTATVKGSDVTNVYNIEDKDDKAEISLIDDTCKSQSVTGVSSTSSVLCESADMTDNSEEER